MNTTGHPRKWMALSFAIITLLNLLIRRRWCVPT